MTGGSREQVGIERRPWYRQLGGFENFFARRRMPWWFWAVFDGWIAGAVTKLLADFAFGSAALAWGAGLLAGVIAFWLTGRRYRPERGTDRRV